VKDVLLKINEQVKKNGWTNVQLFEKVDVNKNGIVERAEFIQFFAQSMQVKGLAIPQDVELLCDALDMNKDNLISVNEFCLCLEGVQHSLD
jgi:Ca2+-binding EF-hand superfamily protein